MNSDRVCSVGTRRLGRAFVVGLLASCTWVANAQPSAFRFEITPTVAHRLGGEFKEADGADILDIDESGAQGFVFNVAARVGGDWEILYARQDTSVEAPPALTAERFVDMDVEYIHFGGNYTFTDGEAHPFLALTVGLSRFDPAFPDSEAENYFSVSLGGGLQFRPEKRFGVRLEGRVYTTFLDSDSQIFCRSGPSGSFCAFQIKGTTLTQWEARAGAVFRF